MLIFDTAASLAQDIKTSLVSPPFDSKRMRKPVQWVLVFINIYTLARFALKDANRESITDAEHIVKLTSIF